MAFVKAVRKQAKLRLALTGPSGAGKTYSALLLAQGLGGKIAVIDTENGSASLYCHLADFDVLDLTAPYSPERYIKAIADAEAAGYTTLIIDSITHEWSGTGGMLQINEQLAASRFRGNTWSAWSESNPRHNKFVDAMTQSKMHIIATMRSKTETAQEKDGNGKPKILQLGMKAEQREGMTYEFTTVLDIVHSGHYATATKDRTEIFSGTDPRPITIETGRMLLEWLNTGAEPPPSLSVDQITAIEGAAASAAMSIEDICKAGKVAALSRIPASSFEKLLTWINSKAIVMEQENGVSQ